MCEGFTHGTHIILSHKDIADIHTDISVAMTHGFCEHVGTNAYVHKLF
jgi:hypothetical protein